MNGMRVFFKKEIVFELMLLPLFFLRFGSRAQDSSKVVIFLSSKETKMPMF
jgi:hypothetical protein